MWLTYPENNYKVGKLEFRRALTLEKVPDALEVRLCADSKYRLYINGKFVCMGPVRPSEISMYYDTVDFAPYLHEGENEIFIELMKLPPFEKKQKNDFECFYTAFLRGGVARLMVECDDVNLDDPADWEVSDCPEFDFHYKECWGLAGEYENIDFRLKERKFVTSQKSDGSETQDPISPYGLLRVMKARPIPFNTFTPKKFDSRRESDGVTYLKSNVETTGAVRFTFRGEAGTKVKITYAEAYFKHGEGDNYYKEMRDDESGVIFGEYDEVTLSGGEDVFESFHFRTFRFIKFEFTGAGELTDAEYFEMKYPLVPSAAFESDDPDCKELWDVSIRTVNNCMHDTFEDCPYYEQLQYAMDSRLQALFVRHLTDDHALVKKCVCDFNESRYEDGMVQARTPSATKQIIPGFALHYIFMIHDYMVYDGDEDFIRFLMPTVDGIIGWFRRHFDSDGVVGEVGRWSYLDWVDEWQEGWPGKGRLSCYNFMFVLALKCAAELARFAGRYSLAYEYRDLEDELRPKVRRAFWDEEKKFFSDGEIGTFSMHPQFFAVLADVVTGEEAKDLLLRTLDSGLPVPSHSWNFFVFRALEKAGLYDRAYKLLDNWRDMLRLNCTTWVENGLKGRSECHGWGSLPIYEFTHVILGVRPDAYGYERVKIKPYVDANEWARGTVSTTHGDVSVSWFKKNGHFHIRVVNDAGVPATVCLPDGSEFEMTERAENFVCRI